MLIKEGMEFSTIDVHGEFCAGKVVGFGKNTFIIEHETEYGIERFLISKKIFQKAGYTFPLYEEKNYSNKG